MLDPDTISKLDQVVATFVEVATTTHYALYHNYIARGFSEEQAFKLVADYAIHHNNGLKDIAVLVNVETKVAVAPIDEDEYLEDEEDEEEDYDEED